MKRWQAIVFDLDDTLYPERDYVLSGMRAVAVWAEGRLGLPADGSFGELRRMFEQGVRGDTFDRWLASHGLRPDGIVAEIVRTYRRHRPQIALEPYVVDLLERLGRRYKLGIVTDGYFEVQQRKVAALDLEPYFQAIVYSDAIGRDAWKPSPLPFKAVLQRLSLSGDEAVYVADNPTKDFRGARQVGMGTIRLRRIDGLHRGLEPCCPDDVPHMEIARLAELDDALLGLSGLRDRMTDWQSVPHGRFTSSQGAHQ